MTAVATHKGGPFYTWYVSVYGYAPPATVDSNAARYLAWQEGLAKGLASQIPYGSIGPPGQFLPGAALIAPVLVTTPASPTPVVAPAATLTEAGVTLVAPFASPAPGGPAAGGGGPPTAVMASANGTYEATAYGPPWNAENGTGVTSTGVDLRDGPHVYVIAADPAVLPMHTHVKISPNPYDDDSIVFSVEDTGGAIKGRHIDIYDYFGRANQLQWGVQNVTVTVVTDAQSKPTTASGKEFFNPLAHASVTAERIDQGVDYAGTGYLVAIADGVCTASVANGSGWENEGYVEYQITQAGFLHGVYVYYAEGIDPVISVGEKLRGGARLCDLRQPMPHGIEIGFAAGTNQESYYRYHDGPYGENNEATRPGLAMSNLIKALGGPPGIIEGEVVGKFPEFMPNGEPPADMSAGSGVAGVLSSGAPTVSAGSVASAFDFPNSWYSAFVQIQRGADNGSHHSHSAQQHIMGITYVTQAN